MRTIISRKSRYLATVVVLILLLAAPVVHAGILFLDDFAGSSPGWSWSTGNGGTVNFNYGGTLLLSNNGGTGNCCSPEFPLVGRNDVFSNINAYWRLSIRFRYPEVTAYGTNISVGSGTFDANSRIDASQPVRTDWGDVLGIHQVAQPVCRFQIMAFGTTHYDQNNGCSGDLDWHTVELEVNGGSYVLRLDGNQIGSGAATVTPRCLWFGNYYIQPYWGNWSDIQVDWVRVETDQEAPVTSAIPNGTTGNTGWWRSPVAVALSASDNWSGINVSQYRVDGETWQSYSSAFTVSGDGTHTVEYRSQDRAGNWELANVLLLAIDTLPPVTSNSVVCATPGGGGWCRGDVSVTLSASDATSGVGGTYYRVNGAWVAYTGPVVFNTDGTYTVEYYSVDVAGNQESPRSVVVRRDVTSPTTSATPSGTAGNGGWWRSPVQISLSATDNASGVASTQYRVDGGAWQAYSEAFTVSGDGTHTVEYRSTDVAGNQENPRSLTIRIDTAPPVSILSTPTAGQWLSGTVTVAGTALDATSGVALVSWSRDGGATWQPVSGTLSWADTWDTTSGPDGTYNLVHRSEDVAGNQENPGSVIVHVDNTPPTTTVTLTGAEGSGGWWRSPVSVSLVAGDGNGIGVASTQYRVDGGDWQSYSVSFTISGDGIHTVEYWSTDVAGNTEDICTQTLRIDTVPPETTASLSGTLGLNGWYTDAVVVTLAITDATSGVAETLLNGNIYTRPLTVTADGRYSWPYFSEDVAGNEETRRILTFGLDAAPPTATVTGGTFCPGCGEILLLQPRASDATSGVGAWRLEITSTQGVIRVWEGNLPPNSIPWNGMDRNNNLTGAGIYGLRLWVQDQAGWTTVSNGKVQVTDVPPPPAPPPVPPSPTPTEMPTASPTSTPRPRVPTPTPRPGEPTATPEPMLTATPVPTPTPMPPSPEPPASAITIVVAVFRDDNRDAQRQPLEAGLPNLRVRVEAVGWTGVFTANAAGLVTITLPGPGTYSFLANRPDPGWMATTRMFVSVRVGEDGSAVLLPAGDDELPVGIAENALLAFGLVPRPLWPLAVIVLGGALLFLGQVGGRMRIADAIHELVAIYVVSSHLR